MRFYEPSEFLPRLKIAFEDLRFRILTVLPRVVVEHVGSSAIRGAISKGDLDVLVLVAGADFADALLQIQRLGFFIKSDTLRSESLCMLQTEQYELDVAIQLVEKGSKFEDFLIFRDLLNSDRDLVEKYNALKRASIGLSPEKYRAKKSDFIEEVLINLPSNKKSR